MDDMVLSDQEVLALAEQHGSPAPASDEPKPVTAPEEEPGFTTVDPYVDPEGAQALANVAMGKEDGPILPPLPPPDEVELEAGWISESGNLFRTAKIRELNGEDEEELAKPKVTTAARFIDTIVNRCVTELGGRTPTASMLKDLLIGDRDAIVLAVRVLTFGPTMDVPVGCPHCRYQFDIELDFRSDIPRKALPGDPKQRQRNVALANGKLAKVNLLTGGMQLAAYDTPDLELNDQQRNTLLLREALYSIDGQVITNIDQVRRLGAADRRTLLKYLAENTCGPRWMEVTQDCPECSANFIVPLQLAATFL